MVVHKGYRRKTRRLFKKELRARGLPGLSRFLADYAIGDKVDILADPTFQKRGLPFRRFHGRTGVIVGIRGRCFEIKVMDLHKEKTLFCGKEHIRINHDYVLRKQAVEAAKTK